MFFSLICLSLILRVVLGDGFLDNEVEVPESVLVIGELPAQHTAPGPEEYIEVLLDNDKIKLRPFEKLSDSDWFWRLFEPSLKKQIVDNRSDKSEGYLENDHCDEDRNDKEQQEAVITTKNKLSPSSEFRRSDKYHFNFSVMLPLDDGVREKQVERDGWLEENEEALRGVKPEIEDLEEGESIVEPGQEGVEPEEGGKKKQWEISGVGPGEGVLGPLGESAREFGWGAVGSWGGGGVEPGGGGVRPGEGVGPGEGAGRWWGSAGGESETPVVGNILPGDGVEGQLGGSAGGSGWASGGPWGGSVASWVGGDSGSDEAGVRPDGGVIGSEDGAGQMGESTGLSGWGSVGPWGANVGLSEVGVVRPGGASISPWGGGAPLGAGNGQLVANAEISGSREVGSGQWGGGSGKSWWGGVESHGRNMGSWGGGPGEFGLGSVRPGEGNMGSWGVRGIGPGIGGVGPLMGRGVASGDGQGQSEEDLEGSPEETTRASTTTTTKQKPKKIKATKKPTPTKKNATKRTTKKPLQKKTKKPRSKILQHFKNIGLKVKNWFGDGRSRGNGGKKK